MKNTNNVLGKKHDIVLKQKQDNLISLLGKYMQEGLLIAFSGGVDSTFLVWAAMQASKQYQGKVKSITSASASLAKQEKIDVENIINLTKMPHSWIISKELDNSHYLQNDANRCYHCKSELFNKMESLAKKENFTYLAYGYTISDEGDVRPGHNAALQRGVIAPLHECGFTKEEIRQCLLQESLPFHDKPATPCLSSRIMTGVAIDKEKLDHINQIELLIKQQGINLVRARLCAIQTGALFVRIETTVQDMPLVLQIQKQLSQLVQSFGYLWVTLDLQGYKQGGGNL